MTDTSTLSQTDMQILAEIAALMIPASDAYGVPGADDPVILAEIAQASLGDIGAVSEALATFAGIDALDAASRAETFRREHSAAANRLQTLIVQCYYRDARVMAALGMEARPPFPEGFDVDQGDWSLLEPVRAMAPIYRSVD